MGNNFGAPEPEFVNGANGQLRKGARVQTQYTIDEGGDGRWYPGTIRKLYAGDQVKIGYDDGDTWKGPAMYVWSLAGPPPPCQQVRPSAPPLVQGVVTGTHLVLPPMPPSEPVIGNEPTCPVCTVNKMDMALQCGHRLCGTCLQSIHASGALCPVCRVPITQVIRCYN
mmetsp:Transcript_70469/g.182801  ORF Transcript_70469/g.182801 Transcript_70469/m.182801 type:complete len:168 (-) Transcript_70469:273-776(-)